MNAPSFSNEVISKPEKSSWYNRLPGSILVLTCMASSDLALRFASVSCVFFAFSAINLASDSRLAICRPRSLHAWRMLSRNCPANTLDWSNSWSWVFTSASPLHTSMPLTRNIRLDMHSNLSASSIGSSGIVLSTFLQQSLMNRGVKGLHVQVALLNLHALLGSHFGPH